MQNPFQKDYSSPADQAWRTGTSPYAGTLGPNRTADAVKNSFAADVKRNPDYANFYNRTFADVAPQSQARIDSAAGTNDPNFSNPGDQSFAKQFAQNYAQGVTRGLIEEDRAVTKDRLARLTTEAATASSSEKDPNTANKYPSQGVGV
jgi:hypothetical protein